MKSLPAHLLVFVAFMCPCNVDVEPLIPRYDLPVILESEPRLTANAEVVDVTGDGLNDIVLAVGRHRPGPNLLFVGDREGRFTAVDTLSETWDRSYSVSAMDMDLDGDVDLVAFSDSPDAKYVALNDGRGNISTRLEFGEPKWPTRTAGSRFSSAIGKHRLGSSSIDRTV